MKYILFTHNDLDGAGCEIAFRVYLKQLRDKQVYHLSIDELPAKVLQVVAEPDNSPDRAELLFSDLTPPYEVLNELINRGYRVKRFDHHPTAACHSGLDPDSQLDVSGEKCGTILLDGYLAELEISKKHRPRSPRYLEFIELIRLWDTWAWAKTNDLRAKYLTNLFWLLGIDRFVDLYSERWSTSTATDKLPVIDPTHLMFVEAKLESAASVIEATTPASVITCGFSGYRAAVTFAGNGFSVSDGSHTFLTRYPEYDLMINVNLGTRKVSLRSEKPEVDVGQLSSMFGGGGHPGAGGFPLTYETMTRIIELCLDRQK